jgi:hypothetical protein
MRKQQPKKLILSQAEPTQNKEGGSFEAALLEHRPLGKGSPIGSNRRDLGRPLFPWFSASSRRDISVRSTVY